MLVIRLRRTGKKNQPSFKMIVTEKKKSPTKGLFVEEVGFWNPLTKEKVLREERIKYWISMGAQTSSTVYNMLVEAKIVDGEKIKKHNKSKKKEEDEKTKEKKVEEKKEGEEKTEEKKDEEKKEEAEPTEKPEEKNTKEDSEDKPKEEPKEEEVKEEAKNEQ